MELSVDAIATRLEDFETIFFRHETFERATKSIALLHKRWKPPKSRKTEAHCLMLLGNSGAGKTTILRRYAARFPDVTENEHGDIRPIVFVEAPKRTTPRQLAAAILSALSPGYKPPARWNTDDLVSEICFQCDEMGVQLIIIDEAHHIVDHRKDDGLEDAAEFVKSLLNRSGAQLVLSGLPRLATKLPKTKTLKQLRRRMDHKEYLKPYNWSSKTGRTQFRTLLALFEGALGLPQPSNLVEFRTAARIYCATEGEIGFVAKHLRKSLQFALERSLSHIDLKLLGEAFDADEDEPADDHLLEFDAAPIVEEPRTSVDDNPYWADEKPFRKLWADMAQGRLRDSSRETGHKKTGTPPQKVF
ncbi:AAA family ATPase [Tardiphaga sp. 367_B4_N1_1]|uniref:AAA family ATPase n=1 Tax=Tardiphaga sp. 367_B4_N1_1 TaxID=3240777 RepID=UPI003F23A9AA